MSHRLLMICGLSNWQDGSALNGNGEDCGWRRFWEENKGFIIRWDANQIIKWRSEVAVRLTTMEFRGEK